MSDPVTTVLKQWMDDGRTRIGQIAITPTADGGFELCHQEDLANPSLEISEDPTQARHIATNDDHNTYRPLKSAPNLRHGWQMKLTSLADLRLALDLFYPAALGMALAQKQGRLTATNVRNTLNRQTGMYRVTGLLSNEDANTLVAQTCKSDGGCLRSILWQIDEAVPIAHLPAEKTDPDHLQGSPGERGIPLLCREICCHLIAAAREKVKSDMRKKAESDAVQQQA